MNTSTVIFCSDVHLCQVDHYDYPAQSRMENLIEKLNAFYEQSPYEQIIFLGDYSLDHWGWCDGGSLSYGLCNTRQFIDRYAVNLKAPYHMAPGNHELYGNEKWKEITGEERNFCLTVGGYLVICCDNFAGELDPVNPSDGIYSPTNLQFVKQKLSEYPDLPVILCSHYFDLQKEPDSFYSFIKNGKRITLLICGHDHLMEITDLGEAAGHVCLYHDGHYSYAGGNNSLSDVMWGFCQAKLTPTGIDIRYIEPENRIHTETFFIDHAYREQCCRFFPRRDINA